MVRAHVRSTTARAGHSGRPAPHFTPCAWAWVVRRERLEGRLAELALEIQQVGAQLGVVALAAPAP